MSAQTVTKYGKVSMHRVCGSASQTREMTPQNAMSSILHTPTHTIVQTVQTNKYIFNYIYYDKVDTSMAQ